MDNFLEFIGHHKDINIVEKVLDLDYMKKEIMKTIKETDDVETVINVFNQLYKNKFETVLDIFVAKQRLQKVNNLSEVMRNEILKYSDFEISLDLISEIKNGNSLINESKLLSSNKGNLLNIVTPKFKKLLEKVIRRTIEFKRSGGDEGPGEITLEVLSPIISKASVGDLIIGSERVEVKGTRSRMISSKKSYGSVAKELPKLTEYFNEIGFTQTKTFSFGMNNIQSINDFIKENKSKAKGISERISLFFENMFGDDKFWKNVYDERKAVIDIKNWRLNMFKYLFEMYKSEDGFDGILFLNKKSLDYIYIKSANDLAKNFKSFTANWGPYFATQRTAGVEQLWLT